MNEEIKEPTNEILSGKNPVLEALRSGREMNKVWIAEGVKKAGIAELLQLAKEAGLIVQFVPKNKIDQLTDGATHQGIAASVAAYKYAELDDLFESAASRNEDPFFLIR
jgi:23S rRNA (guanosine2251-2'-O)-methyltransferase